MTICDVMTDRTVSIGEEETVCAAAKLLKRYNIGSMPVHDDKGRLRGILTDRDIVLRCVAAEDDPASVKVREIMSRGLVTVTPFDDVSTAAERMAECQVRRLPVAENGRLVGVIALCDLLRRDEFSTEAAEALTEISSQLRRKQ